MKNISIATFISTKEHENNDFIQTIEFLSHDFNIDYFILADEYTQHNGKKIDFVAGKSKYKRIEAILKLSPNNIILCIDNDIVINKENTREFLIDVLEKDFALAWGKIQCQQVNGFVSNLIKIDKNLSHNMLRPFLWAINKGISIPGQVFCINKPYFNGLLNNYDTVFDDLTLGLICKKNLMPVFYLRKVLGYERPKGKFKELIQQRKRWAQGFSESMKYSKQMKIQRFVLLHGAMYHLLWIPFYIILCFLYEINPVVSVIYILFSLITLSDCKFSSIFWAFFYILIFPIVHIFWFFTFIKKLFDTVKKSPQFRS